MSDSVASAKDVLIRNWLLERTDAERITFQQEYDIPQDTMTEIAMGLSLCPIHFIDWAICFDDGPLSCKQIRECFPNSHDT